MNAGKDAHVPASQQLLLWVKCCMPLIPAEADVPGCKEWHSLVYKQRSPCPWQRSPVGSLDCASASV